MAQQTSTNATNEANGTDDTDLFIEMSDEEIRLAEERGDIEFLDLLDIDFAKIPADFDPSDLYDDEDDDAQ